MKKLFISTVLSSTFFIFATNFGCTTVDKDLNASSRRQTKDVRYSAKKEALGPRKRLMILPFLDSNEARPQSLRDLARKEFIRELNRTGEVIVVDSADIKIDPSKQIKDNEYVLSSLAKDVSSLGVAAVLEGKIINLKVTSKADPVGLFRQMKTHFEASVRVRLALARTGREIYNTVKTVSLEETQTRVAENVNADRLLQTNPELLEKLVTDAFLDFQTPILAALSKLGWEGRIALVNGDRIFLNVGVISGLQIGDILKVSEEGEDIFDPQTGNYIGKSPGRLKGTLEVISYFGQDGAIAIIHSGAGFKENDKVEQY